MRSCCLLLLMALAGTAAAQPAVRLQASSVGIGVEAAYRLNQNWQLRGGYLGGDLDVDFAAENNNGVEGDELQYDGEISLDNGYLFADWLVWAGRFHVSGGLVFNNSDATIVTSCQAESFIAGTESCEFGFSRFSPAVLGELTTHIDYELLAPFLGVGWTVNLVPSLLLSVDLGVVYVGDANVQISSSGSCNDSGQCRQALQQEEEELRRDLDDYSLLPLVGVGLSYRF